MRVADELCSRCGRLCFGVISHVLLSWSETKNTFFHAPTHATGFNYCDCVSIGRIIHIWGHISASCALLIFTTLKTGFIFTAPLHPGGTTPAGTRGLDGVSITPWRRPGIMVCLLVHVEGVCIHSTPARVL